MSALSRVCAVALSFAFLGAGAAAEPAIDWPATARQDIRFAAATIAARHAGAIGGQSSVTEPLATGLRVGLAEADGVRTERDYLRLMMRFIAGFGDPHTGIDLHLQTRGWTGIVLDRVDGRYRVVWSEPGWPSPLPPAGAVAQSCDDAWVGTYLKNAVAPFVNRSVEYAGTFGSLAQQSMFDLGLGWTPAQCVFDLPDGTRRRYALPLQRAADAAAGERMDGVRLRFRAAAKPVGLTPLGAGRWWVGMPNFDGAKSGSLYDALYARLATVKDARWIVFDLRGNGGGDSSLGQRALAVLYGAPYADQLAEAGGMQKFLIADATTIALLEGYMKASEFADATDEFAQELAAVRAAMSAGRKLAQVSGPAALPDAPLPPLDVPRTRGPRLAAIIDRNCFSSCMNFVQQIQATGDAVLLGEPTLGYSPYGEIARIDLPSGHGSLRVPSALFNTAQATREPFVPDYPYAGSMADDAALAAWVGRMLESIKGR
jgi:hypothetical protein